MREFWGFAKMGKKRGKKEEVRGKKEEGRRRGKREEGKRKRDIAFRLIN